MNIVEAIKAPYLRFGNEVSTQDLLKSFAFVGMVLDHLGGYFFSDHALLRVIGRTTLPVWFFFVGYNFKPQNIFAKQLAFYALLLAIAFFFVGKILPLNALFSMLISRIIIYYYSQNSLKTRLLNLFEWFFISAGCLLFFSLSNCLFEYGFLGVLMAIWGYNLRNRDKNIIIQTITISFLVCFTQINAFHFSLANSIICIILVNLTIYALYKYQPRSFKFNNIGKYLINISSRYTLYLYCLHLLLFLFIKANFYET